MRTTCRGCVNEKYSSSKLCVSDNLRGYRCRECPCMACDCCDDNIRTEKVNYKKINNLNFKENK